MTQTGLTGRETHESASLWDRVVARLGLPGDRRAVWYGIGALVNALGTGLFYPFSVLYFHQRLGLSLTSIGMGLSVATAVSLVGVTAAGRLVDRTGARTVLVTASVLRGLAYVGFLVGGSLPAFVCCAVLDALCLRIGQLAEQAAIADTADPASRNRWYALSRTLLNIGVGGGGLLAGVLVSVQHTYLPLLVANAASFLLAAGLYLVLSDRPEGVDRAPAGSRSGPVASVLRDRLFLLASAANAVLWLCALLLELGLPVFLVEYAKAPPWTVSVVFGVNTALVVLFELPLTNRTNRYPRLAVVGWGAALHVVAFALLAPLGILPVPAAAVVLVVGVVIFTLGEILSAVAATVATTALAPPARRGSFLAVSHLMVGVASAVAPVLVTQLLALTPLLLWAVAGSLAAVVTVALFGASAAAQRRIDDAEREVGA